MVNLVMIVIMVVRVRVVLVVYNVLVVVVRPRYLAAGGRLRTVQVVRAHPAPLARAVVRRVVVARRRLDLRRLVPELVALVGVVLAADGSQRSVVAQMVSRVLGTFLCAFYEKRKRKHDHLVPSLIVNDSRVRNYRYRYRFVNSE